MKVLQKGYRVRRAAPRLGYAVFKQGDRVIRIATGQAGTVLRQFTDGYVVLNYDGGGPAELPASVLEVEKD